MLFNSIPFIFLFLPLSFLVYWRLPIRFRTICLVVLSVVFYSFAGIEALLLLTVLTVITFCNARFFLSQGSNARKRLGIAIILLNLSPLLFFKYFSFFSGLFNTLGLSSFSPTSTAILPLGISFYTFNLIGYSIDVYKGRVKPQHTFIDFASYITFFPALISGPLIRFADFHQQEANNTSDNNASNNKELLPSNVELGIVTFSMGVIKKVLIADTLRTFVNLLFDYNGTLGLIGSWTAALGFTYQLYFDFSGYTDMAIGIAYLFGFKLPQNFNAPYTARSITEFWQRWHITLSNWFRDYVFLPLSRALLERNKNWNPDLVRFVCLTFTMTLVGLWHGANWTFIVWGLFQGILLSIHAQMPKFATNVTLSYVFRALTFLLVILGWTMFRSSSLAEASDFYASMFGFHGLGLSDLGQVMPFISKAALYLQLGILFIITNSARDMWVAQPRKNWVFTSALAFLTVASVMLMGGSMPFLYFRF